MSWRDLLPLGAKARMFGGSDGTAGAVPYPKPNDIGQLARTNDTGRVIKADRQN